MSLSDKLKSTGPKRLLALDGGGIRGLITLEILGEIERVLRLKLGGREGFVLADYFDYIAGTSTGAIIATALSLGWPVSRVRSLYETSGRQLFDKASLLKRFRYRYEDEKLALTLKREFGETTTLGSDDLKTLLMLVMRNATTDSPWPVSNNPQAKYNDRARADCNLNIPLWQLVRASTAAPVYFPPEVVRVGEHQFVFLDGGITTYNNPAFLLFLMATLEPYRLRWSAGEQQVFLVSVGTGTNPDANVDLDPAQMNVIYNATSIPSALMFAALNEQDMLARVFGRCRAGEVLDREIGDLISAGGPVEPRLFTYVRYNVELSGSGLNRLGVGDIEPRNVQKLDSVDHMNGLKRVGAAAAKMHVSIDHFAGFV